MQPNKTRMGCSWRAAPPRRGNGSAASPLSTPGSLAAATLPLDRRRLAGDRAEDRRIALPLGVLSLGVLRRGRLSVRRQPPAQRSSSASSAAAGWASARAISAPDRPGAGTIGWPSSVLASMTTSAGGPIASRVSNSASHNGHRTSDAAPTPSGTVTCF